MVGALVLMGVLASLAALLWIPVELHFEARGGEHLLARLRVYWLYGRVRHELSTDDPKKPRKEKKKKKKKKDSKRDLQDHWNDLKRLWESQLRPRMEALFKELGRRIERGQLHLHGTLGLGDPASTGIAMAWLLPLVELSEQLNEVDVQIEPCYDRAEISGDAQAMVRLVPMRILTPILAFALTPSNLREAHQLWKAR